MPRADGAPTRDTTRDTLHVLVGIVMDDDGRILISQRRPGTHMAGAWEFPGGKRAAHETRFDALRRELAEELGIEVLAATPWIELTHDYPERLVNLDVWRVERYSGSPEGLEGQALRWVSPAELPSAGVLPADQPIVERLLSTGKPCNSGAAVQNCTHEDTSPVRAGAPTAD